MNHSSQDLTRLARQILGHSLVVFLCHHDEARAAAPDNAEELIATINALAAQRMANATIEQLLQRKSLLYAQHAKASRSLGYARGRRSTMRPGSRSRVWIDRSSYNRAGVESAEREMSLAIGEIELIQAEIDLRRANAQARA